MMKAEKRGPKIGSLHNNKDKMMSENPVDVKAWLEATINCGDGGYTELTISERMASEILTHIRELEARAEAAEAKVVRLRIALQPFSTFGRHNTDERGWYGLRCENERIRVWFGPADFRAALEAMETK